MRVAVLACAALVLAAGCSNQAPPAARTASSPDPAPTAPLSAAPSATALQATPPVPVDVPASYARTQPGPPAASAGSISGRVNCACGGIVAQDVYAISIDARSFYATQTATGQSQWTILGIPPGQYYLYSAARHPNDHGLRHFAAGYTVAVACGLSVSCVDHSPVAVTVRSGSDTGDVEIFDWYSTDFPLVPMAGPPAPFLQAPPISFGTAADAAAYLGVQATDAPQVAGPAECPVNRACFWLASSRTGPGAAYYVAMAGSNGLSVSCGLYLVGGGSSWRTLQAICRASFPMVGASVTVRHGPPDQTGCLKVHEQPILSSPVTACLADGSVELIDDGPTYVATGAANQTDDFWWHLAGSGWIMHTYVINLSLG